MLIALHALVATQVALGARPDAGAFVRSSDGGPFDDGAAPPDLIEGSADAGGSLWSAGGGLLIAGEAPPNAPMRAADVAAGEGEREGRGRSTVVIGARDGSMARADPAAASSVVSLDRPPRSGETVADLVAELPGVALNRLGALGSLALVSIRGSTWEQVRVLVDGVPLNSATGGGVDLSTIPLGDIERIEVYRGSSPLAFGSSALGGIVSITTRSPKTSGASAQGGIGSFGTRGAGVSGSLAGTVGAFAGGSWESAVNDFVYFSNHGTAFDSSDDGVVRRANSAHRQLSGTLRVVGKLPGRRELSAVVSGFNRQQGLPGFGLFPTTAASLDTRRVLSALSYRGADLGEGGKVNVTASLGWATTGVHDVLGEITVGGADILDTTWTLGLTAYTQRRLGPFLLAGVAEGRWERFLPRDEVRSPPAGAPASRLSFATGLESSFHLEALSLDVTPSVRFEGARDIVSGRAVLGGFADAAPPIWRTQPVARLAFLQRPHSDWTLKANLGRYARFANFNELYGDSGFIIGNPGLKPESGYTGDLGAAWSSSEAPFSIHGELFGFANLITDLIQYEQSGHGVSRADNVGQARILGVEALARAELGPFVRLWGQFTFTDARDTTRVAAHAFRQLPLRPRGHVFARAELRRVSLPLGLRAGASVDLDATQGTFLDPANFIELPPRLLLGASVSLSWSTHARVVFSARNLTDSRISDFGGYPLPGRSFFATLALFTHDVVDR